MAPLSDSPSTEQLLESLPIDENIRISKRHGCLSTSPENPLAVGYPFSPYRRRKLNGSSSSFSSQSTLKLKVTFNETVQIRKFTPNWALPREQGSTTTDEESTGSPHLHEMHQNRQLDFQCIETLKQASDTTACATSLEEEHGWCARGVECHFEETCIAQRRKSKLQTALVVLLYQARGEAAEEIARHYSTISRASQTRAWRQGLLDELDAKHDLGISVLQSLKTKQSSNAPQHSSQLNRAMQELKYYQHLAGSTTNGESSRRRSQRLANIFTV
eukprot:Nitzschia sp. Nitz4//scaffold37_size175936//82680//83501//NITZ4_002046-RA/size175936-processed-gene-0.189-mRNA-1//1//CDS//3329549788//4656//frame0